MSTAHDISLDAEAFRASYPHWPHPEPPAPSLVPCKPCGNPHIPLTTPCPLADPCPDCLAPAGELCHWWCPNMAESPDRYENSDEGSDCDG